MAGSNQNRTTSLIIKNEVFEPITIEDVPMEKRSKIFIFLILLKRKRDQHQEITKYKARMVLDGSRAQIGIDVFDTYAPVIDYSTVRLLISLAFGNKWEMFHWDISVKAEEELELRFKLRANRVFNGLQSLMLNFSRIFFAYAV